MQYDAPAPASSEAEPCSRLEIEPTKNGGFAVKCYYRPTQNKRGSPSDYREPDSYAFSSLAELDAFLAQLFGGSAAPAPPATTPQADDAS